MSYSTRVYRQRNAHVHDNETNKEQSSFFHKKNENAAMQQGNSFFQTKLSVGQPNDAYEKEADSVANAIVNHQPGNKPVVQQKKISTIQRLATPLEEEKLSTNEERMKMDKEIQEKPELQRMCTACEKEKEKNPVQKKSDNGGIASPQLSSKIEGSTGKGNSLPQKTLSEMNNSFGVDFNTVSIHTDSDAAQLNKELGAQAFTHGTDIYFNNGRYNPQSSEGKQLLAHELTHVVQQTGMIQKQNETNIFEDLGSIAGNVLSNGCRKETQVACPGTSSNFQRLGYLGPMTLVNTGSCTLFIHGIDASGNSIASPNVEILPGSQRFFMPSLDAVDTLVVCHKECNGSGSIEHPYNCA